jgi:undecaprenyl-diphosphatase
MLPFSPRDLLRKYPILYILIGLGISAFMLALFIELTTITFVDKNITVFDDTIISLVRYFASPNLNKLMIFITNIGSAYSYGVLVPIIIILLALQRQWRDASSLSICLVGAGVLNTVLKSLFERARPNVLQLVKAGGYSFPSGHSMVALCFYGMLAYLLSRRLAHWHGRLAIFVATTILIIAIGISRIYLGVHYPSDVLGGYIAGAIWLSFCISLLIWWENHNI